MVRLADVYADNVLVIPDGLHGFEDATSVMDFGKAGIFHKLIRKNMIGIEFIPTAPCLAFVVRGQEQFTVTDGSVITLRAEEMLFMPAGSYMVSDFANGAGPLEAFLFFFSSEVIDQFLSQSASQIAVQAMTPTPYKLDATQPVSAYMAALHSVYDTLSGSAGLLRTKLLELLFLLAELNDAKRLNAFLTGLQADVKRRNVRAMMQNPEYLRFSVADLAQLSGRSVSGFGREFKRNFGQSPQPWLIEARLKLARTLVETTSKTITEIAADVGYDDTSHFIKTFRRQFGATPISLRKAVFDR